MKKIISLFQRNPNHLFRDEVTPGAEWVSKGEGVATRKFDGTSCLWRDGRLWKRYELKTGKVAPAGFEAAQEADPVTGKTPGWVPVSDGPDDRWHCEAALAAAGTLEEGATYELCGPRIQKNPERFETHVLVRHGSEILGDAPRTFFNLIVYLFDQDIEGIVWHHPDGRMVKVKGKDFGFMRDCAPLRPKPAAPAAPAAPAEPVKLGEQTMAWRPITDTSPPWDGVPVLVWRMGDAVWLSGRGVDSRGYGMDWYLGARRFPPTHWMPIPAPPIELS